MMKCIAAILIYIVATRAFAGAYESEDVQFLSHGAELSGTIVFPVNGKVHAAVVFVHGSGEQTRNMHWAEKFAEQGIAALVYDKRGVGKSGGEYEGQQSVSGMNIALLADDASAALSLLASRKQLEGIPLGLAGISQAGWIVPLAAEKNPAVNFMVLWSGPVCKVSEEDIYSKYTTDRDDNRVPSYARALQSRKTKYIWPDFLGTDSDPSESLAKLKIPGLWIYGERDGSIPVDLSIQRLKLLINSGHSYEYVLFSGLGHNNMTETFATVGDWVRRVPK